MKQKIYFAKSGAPQAGLAPVFISLQIADDGTDFLPLPVISEIDDGGNANGWYAFDQPDTSKDLVGVVDGDPGGLNGLAAAERYVPVVVTPDDFGMTDLVDALVRGSRVLDPESNTLTLTRRDGVTTLIVFDVTKPLDVNLNIGPYIERKPQ